MKLYEKLPHHVTVNGKRVRVNLEFRNVLRMMDILNRQDILPEAREWLAMKCICRRPRKGMAKVVINMLFPKQREHERITDFEQDADLIRAAFWQEYGINLFRDRLNWFEFSCLLSCIPEGTRYSNILNIRARPLPEPTAYNAKEREWLLQAKAEFGLHETEQEQMKRYRRDVAKLGELMSALAREGNNG